ncbi:phage tail tip fiber protein [Vreelandella sp. 21]|uniref:phage tail tip fiber protein n=1 Tax=Vreelandella sp. 21 TaxID=3402864 RepID=UPI003D9A9211
MNRRRRTLPPVPPKAPSELRPLIAAMTEILETGEGVRGDPLDRKVTLRDLLDSGIGKLKPGMRPGQDGNLDSGALPPAPDLSIPPAPANFDAQGGFYGMINLSWTIPGQQYRNHAYTNIFRSEEDNFANAEVIGREAGGFYTDYVRDDAVDPDDPTKLKGYYYWITFTSVADIEGPPNSPNGTYAAPLADVGYVLELLTGEIDAGVLAQSLREEIEKIPAIESNIERIGQIETAIERIGPIETAIERLDPIETAIERIGPIEAELRGPESLDGSVANRIAAERDDRIEALESERIERIDSLTFEAQARAQAIQGEVENRTTAITQAVEQLELEDSLLALQQNVIAATYDANAASIYSMSQVRINDNEVFATQIDQLYGSVEDNNALILNERQIRIDQNSSLVTQVGILAARLDARPSLASSFEPGSDFDAWIETAGSNLSPETSDVYAGQQAALVSSTTANANPQTHGIRRTVDSDTASEFAGNEIRFSLYAKQPNSNGSAEFAIAYCVDGAYGEWVRFTPTGEYTFYDVVVDVPANTGELIHELVIWGDTAGSGNGVFVDRVLVTFAETDIPEVTAAIEQIHQALADQEQAVASQLQGFLSQLDDNTAAINNETETRSTQYGALASDLQTLTAQTQSNAADIAAEREAWTSAVEAVAGDVLDLWASVGENEARITGESRVRATEDDLLAAVQRVISASRGTASATFYSLDEVRLADSAATALRIDGVEVQLADAFSAIELEQSLRASENQALATQINTAVAELDGDISTVQQTLSTEVTRLDDRVDATAQAVTAVQSQIDSDLSTVQQNFETEVSRIDEQLSINAQAITDVQASTDDALSAVQQDFNAQTSYLDERINSNAQALTEVRSDLEGDVAGVQQNLNTQVSRLDGRVDSTAQALITVQSQLEDELSTVQQNFNTEVSRLDGRVDSTAQAITNVQSASEEALAGVQQDFNTEVSFLKNEQAVVSAVYKASAQSITAVQAGFENNLATVQESLTTDVTRLDGRIDSQAQALTTVQSQLESDITTVQQNFNTAVTRLDGDISANAQAISDVQSATDDSLAGVQQDFNTEVTRLDGRIDVNAQAVTEVRSDLEGDVAGVQQNLNTQVSRLDGRVDSAAQSISTVQSQLSGDISTVQQNLTTNVNRIDDEIDANAQAITDVQSATDDALAGVQQDFNTEIARVDDAIDANANAIIEVRSDLGSDIATVQQRLNTNVNRIDGNVANNAQAITTAQSQLDGQISTVQQNLNSEISRVDGQIEATAELVQSVQTDLGNGLNAVEVRAMANAGSVVANGQFATGDLSGWSAPSLVDVVEADGNSGTNAIRTMPTRYAARWDAFSGWGDQQILRGSNFSTKGGEAYTFRISYAGGGNNVDVGFVFAVGWLLSDGRGVFETVFSKRVTSTAWDTSPLIKLTAPEGAVRAYTLVRRLPSGSGALHVTDIQGYHPDSVVGSLYTAKVQSGGLIGGFGIYNDGTEVDAGFDVDRFWLGRTNSNKRKPFIMDGDVVYINNAMIRNGSIQEGHLGPITIGKFFLDDGTPVTTAGGLIRADAIDVDNLSVAEAARFYADVQSGNYIAGQSGWRIRQNGNVEFNEGQFNGVVNIGNVSGAGSLATKNSLSYSEVSGAKPPTNADRTASNTAADTAKVGGWDAATVRDMANRGNLAHGTTNGWTRPGSTLIWGNRISTADAYVDTLVIQGNAVTIPVSTAASSVVSLPQSPTDREILSASIDAKGANVMVMVSFGANVGNGGYRVEIRRNGTTVIARPGVNGAFSVAAHVGAESSGVSTFTVHVIGNFTDISGRSLGLLATRR